MSYSRLISMKIKTNLPKSTDPDSLGSSLTNTSSFHQDGHLGTLLPQRSSDRSTRSPEGSGVNPGSWAQSQDAIYSVETQVESSLFLQATDGPLQIALDRLSNP
ncbi:unnamed protein product [Pleuronectes platessa]|uniref:Uncharacterized protein n=1 Tax=Pleuronectes platessa TaxID=8262 RepID=A0A9N7VU25_PLEPL|nr:unnamed protein product [Pleuronectes platessa]